MASTVLTGILITVCCVGLAFAVGSLVRSVIALVRKKKADAQNKNKEE